MSEINWGTFGATNDPRTYAAISQARSESRRLQQEQDLNDRKFVAQQAQQQATQSAYQQAAKLYAAGDYDGAKAAVLGVGNHELMNATNTSSTQSFEQHRQGLQVVGSYAKWIAENVPDIEARKAYIAQNRQMFINAGADEDDIDAVAADPSDTVLGGVAHMYYTPEKQDETKQKAYDGETARITATNPVVVGGSLVTRGGEEIYRSPEYINAPQGSNVYEVGGVSSNGYVQMSSDQVFGNMIQAESRGQQFASNGKPLTSGAGAIGIAQVMPGTAPEAARLAGLPWDANRYRNDAEYNKALGRAYFDMLVKRYNGDHEKAVAAYNAGAGRVDQAVARGGANWRAALPAETQGYVTKVLGRRDTTRPTRQIQQAVDTSGNGSGGKSGSTKPPTEGQQKAGSYARRIAMANATFDTLEQEGYKAEGAWNGIQRWAGELPGGGYAMSEQTQRQEQAERDFINAQLRRESGAVISDTEFASAAKQYFPRPGDGAQVLAQKKRARMTALQNMRHEAGAAAHQPARTQQKPSSPESKTVGGKTYYRVNGAWYDNPEGR